jgi:integrase
MPSVQRGQPYKTTRGWGCRYYDEHGFRQRKSGFKTRSEAIDWFENVERPRQLGLSVAAPDRKLSEFVQEYLAAHKVGREPSTIRTLKERLGYATKAFGDVNLRDLEHRAAEVAKWTTTLPAGSRYGIVQAFRQAVAAAIRWGYMATNPVKAAGKNPQPPAAAVEPLTPAEVESVAVELGPVSGPMVRFWAEVGLRPEELLALERRDVDRQAKVVRVERTVHEGRVKGYGKTSRARRAVPLSDRALQALDGLAPRLDTTILFPGARGSHLNYRNWRHREWYPALDAAGIAKRGPYALRHTFASNALHAGIPSSVLAHVFGSSERMIDRVYSHLGNGSDEMIRARLNAWANGLGQDGATAERREGVKDAETRSFGAGFLGGRYWARTSDPQLVELVLSQLS